MSATQTTRGALADHVVVRLADEGVPISAIGRAVRRPYAEIHAIIVQAREAGDILTIPPSDWPVGSRRDNRTPQSVALPLAETDRMVTALMRSFALQPNEAKMLAALIKHPDRTKASLHAVINEDNTSDSRILAVYVCRMRKKLASHGISIDTVWGRGFFLPPASRALAVKAVEEFEASLTRLEA